MTDYEGKLKRLYLRIPFGFAVLASLMLCAIPWTHMCELGSWRIEVSAATIIVLGVPAWTWLARTPASAWRRAVIGLVLAGILQSAYVRWLHSPSFPANLLDADALSVQQSLQEESNNQIQDIGTNAPNSDL